MNAIPNFSLMDIDLVVGQLGGTLFLGVGACFLTTVIILPGIFGLIERKKPS